MEERLKAAHSGLVEIEEASFVGFKKRALFRDREYGEWTAYVYAVCRGGRHPDRAAAARTKSPKKFKAELERALGHLVTLKEGSFKGLTKKATFVDCDYGEWVACPQNVLRGKGHPDRASKIRAESKTIDVEDIRMRLQQIHQGKVALTGPYLGMLKKTTFRDEDYGEFEALPANVIHKATRHPKGAPDRRVKAFLERFGVRHHLQNDEQFKRAWKSRCAQYEEAHWKTGSQLVCTARWELKVVRWLNENKLDYLWQPKAFKMPNGRTYRPDAYVIPWDTWIEVKGYMQPQSQAKWEWFQSVYPNSELWDKTRLLELGIL